MTSYSATQDVTFTICGDSFDLEATYQVRVKFEVIRGQSETLESPAEPDVADIKSFSFQIVSDEHGIFNDKMRNAVTEALERSQDWLLAEAAETDAAAEDDRADALREERALEVL